MSTLNSIVRLIAVIIACITMGGCSTIKYYTQSVAGQIEIFVTQQPSSQVIIDDRTDPIVKEKLNLISDILHFAHVQIQLPDNGSYRSYADLQRQYVVWNIFAAPEFSLQPRQWCFLIIGCLKYKGYFKQADAKAYADKLQKQGWEIFVGGVTAYSTLGWFKDPILNTMLNREDWEIARVIFHELAHQKLYIENDSEFNEAFADSVAIIGVNLWLQNRPIAEQQSAALTLSIEDQFFRLVLDAQNGLEALYRTDQNELNKRINKTKIIDELRQGYRSLKQNWDGNGQYDKWMESEINNAKLAAVSTYRNFVPVFLRVYRETGDNLLRFYSAVEDISNCPDEKKYDNLKNFDTTISCR